MNWRVLQPQSSFAGAGQFLAPLAQAHAGVRPNLDFQDPRQLLQLASHMTPLPVDENAIYQPENDTLIAAPAPSFLDEYRTLATPDFSGVATDASPTGELQFHFITPLAAGLDDVPRVISFGHEDLVYEIYLRNAMFTVRGKNQRPQDYSFMTPEQTRFAAQIIEQKLSELDHSQKKMSFEKMAEIIRGEALAAQDLDFAQRHAVLQGLKTALQTFLKTESEEQVRLQEQAFTLKTNYDHHTAYVSHLFAAIDDFDFTVTGNGRSEYNWEICQRWIQRDEHGADIHLVKTHEVPRGALEKLRKALIAHDTKGHIEKDAAIGGLIAEISRLLAQQSGPQIRLNPLPSDQS